MVISFYQQLIWCPHLNLSKSYFIISISVYYDKSFINALFSQTHLKEIYNYRRNIFFTFRILLSYFNLNWKLTQKEINCSFWFLQGLGSLMAEEAKDYFANIDDHRRYFKWSGEIDSRALEVCFAKDKWNARKIWIMRTMSLQAQIENEVCWKPLSLESLSQTH